MTKKSKKYKLLSVHNFDISSNPISGIFYFRLLSSLSNEGYNINELCLRGLGKFMLTLKYAIRLRKIQTDVLHVQYGSLLGFISLFIRVQDRKIITLRGSDFYFNSAGSFSEMIHSFAAILFTFISLPFYDTITVVSFRMYNELPIFFRRKCIVINDGVDIELFNIKNYEQCCSYLALDKSKKYIGIGTVSTKNAMKRIEFLLEVISELKKIDCLYEPLVLTGIDPNKMPFYYNCMKVFILGSDYEGFPNVIKESLSCGIPFVSTDVSDLKELNCVENQSCKVVDRNISAFVAAVRQVELVNHSDFKLRTSLRSSVFDLSLDQTKNIYMGLYKCGLND